MTYRTGPPDNRRAATIVASLADNATLAIDRYPLMADVFLVAFILPDALFAWSFRELDEQA